jgi:putative PIN family toxin of toxin-antitoxin system
VKVFIDTNVWLAGRFGRGLCADLLGLLLAESIEVLLDDRVRAEFHRIARQKFRIDDQTLTQAEVFFQRYAHIAPSATKPLPAVPDPDDAWIVAAALIADADYFLTGDKQLLALERIDAMAIIDPRQLFLRLKGFE